MARMRLKTFPKMTIQSTGWTARVRTSVGSRMSFLSSISAMAAVCWKNAKTAGGSAEAANGTARGADVTVISLLLNCAPAEMNENVVERRSRPDAGLQIGGGSPRRPFLRAHCVPVYAEF